MTTDAAIIARLDVLERRVAELAQPALAYAPTGSEPPDFLLDLQRLTAFAGDVVEAATVEITGPIDEALAQRVIDEIGANWRARTLIVAIDSEGGGYNASLAIYRAIRCAPAMTKIATLGRECSSAAVTVALACDRRIARADTVVVIHRTGCVPDSDRRWTASDHLAAAREQTRLDSRLLSLLAERSGAPFDVLAREAATDAPSSLDWLVANGIVHEVEPAR